MKRYKTATILLFGLSLFTIGCDEDETENISQITDLPVINIEGDNPLVLDFENLPDSYTDPGAKATINGEEVPVETNSTVDLNNSGAYSVVYTAYSEEGFARQASRTVVLKCPRDEDISIANASASTSLGTSGPSTVSKLAEGAFEVTNIAPGIFGVPVGATLSYACDVVTITEFEYSGFTSGVGYVDTENNTLVIEWGGAAYGLPTDNTTTISY